LLAALYWHCDWRLVTAALVQLDSARMSLALVLFVPQTLVSAWRWRLLTAGLCRLSLGEAVRQTLAASAWNLAAPSKLGDFSKAAMLPIKGTGTRRSAMGFVVLEKAADVGALLLLWLGGAACCTESGWLITLSAAVPVVMVSLAILRARYSVLSTQYPVPSNWRSALCTPHSTLRTPHSAFRLASASLLLWLLHLVQIHLMLLAAGVSVGFDVSLARIPAAIFAGLLPLSLCGVGTRDGALIWLFSDVAPAGTMAAVGLLTATRYLVPGAIGIPLVWRRRQLAPTFLTVTRSTRRDALRPSEGG
jgi:hypothetical protein